VKLTGTYRKLVKNTTINDTTLLSTDYLNHYNELVMMLEMVSDMPDMLEEVETWQPKTYQQHFRDSAFQHKELAVWAYEHAPDEYREPMDDCIARMDADISTGLPELRVLADAGNEDRLKAEASALTGRLRGWIDTMSALINGALDSEGYQARLQAEGPSETAATVMDQSSIDALFD
jgi:hypothetical protein